MPRPNGYSRVPIAAAQALAGSDEADFAVFLPGADPAVPVLYRKEGAEVYPPDFERLSENGVTSLYVRTSDLTKCESILEARLADVLQNDAISSDEKADLVYHVGTAVARDMTSSPESPQEMDRAAQMVDSVIACVLADPLVASNMLYMAGHERTTASHMFVVSTLAVMLGNEVFGPHYESLRALGFAGMMHDIGKLAINPEVLNKTTALTQFEALLIQQHPIESVRMLGNHPEATPSVRKMILQHHERVDGRGYPVGVSGSDLLAGSRILAVVDSFHAMIGRRTYRSPLTAPEANRALNSQADRQFDRDVLQAWNGLFERCWVNGHGIALPNDSVVDDISSRHEHRPTPPPPRAFGYRAKRFACSGNVTVSCYYAGRLIEVGLTPDEFVAPVRDVSRSGLCLYSAHPMYRGEIVHLRLSDGKREYWVRGSIAWCRQHHDGTLYRSGVQFVQRIAAEEAQKKMPVRGMGDMAAAPVRLKRHDEENGPTEEVAVRDEERSKTDTALQTLSRIADMRNVPLESERMVIALASSAEAEIRVATVDVLMKIKSKAARTALLGLLSDGEDSVRERAVVAAGALQMSEALTLLRQMLTDPVKAIALRAAGALGRMGDGSGLALVSGVLLSDCPDTRLAAVAYGEIVGHRFAANADGVTAARRYFSGRKLVSTG